MRKIYSLVLLAAALLIGTNAWADNVAKIGSTEYATLEAAFAAATTGQTIELLGNVNQTTCIEINSETELTLNMAGYTIEFLAPADANPKTNKPSNFYIFHGKLHVIGGGTIKNTTAVNSSYKYNSVGVHVFYLKGSENSNDAAYTVLTIGQGTTIDCVSGKNAIEVDAVNSKAFGVRVYVDGTCHGEKYGIQLSGNVKTTTPADAQFPYFHIQSHAYVYANASSATACGVYSGGYGIWLIEGRVEGSTGVYVKGGDVTINNATIHSTNTTGHGVESSKTSGVDAGGSAIVTESNNSYAGNISVTISGTSTVSTDSPNGYAIQDTTTTAAESQTMEVTITGGTITGGTNGGAVKIDESTGDVVTVEGGTFTGDISTLIDHTSDDGGSIIQDVVSTDGEGNATVVIGKPAEGSTVPAISPTAQDTIDFNFSGVDEHSIVTLKATANTGNLSYTLSGDGTTTEMQYLSLKADATKTIAVTVAAGHTMKVGQIVMDENAQIVVEAGAKLLVTGSNGIFANNVDNLVLRANATEQATFVISPDVTTNTQPKAKVEYYTTAKGGTSSSILWQRLTSPLSVYSSITHNYVALGSPELVPGATSFRTWIEYFSENDQQWHAITAYSQMKAFTSYALTNNTVNGGITYTFSGNVQGNVDNNIELPTSGWNYMGNAFLAPMHVKSLLTAISANAATIDGTVYLWDVTHQRYIQKNMTQIVTFNDNSIVEIPALQSFIINLTSDAPAMLDVNYATTIYNYVINPSSYSAPERAMNNYTSVRLHIESESGDVDDVYVVEGDNFSAEYESGADAIKYMNEGMNFFIADNENLSMIASDNVMGTILSLQSSEDINYTITFDNVRGEVYALRDNLTNTVVLMNEGATYNFTAQPNAVLDGRFQIVSRQEMPTAVETIEETVAPKAIYTIMGQYVGETTDWNNLPAGVYVVDGVKVIK